MDSKAKAQSALWDAIHDFASDRHGGASQGSGRIEIAIEAFLDEAKREAKDPRYPDHCYRCERPCRYAGEDPENGAQRCQSCLDEIALRARVEELETAERTYLATIEAVQQRVEELEARLESLADQKDTEVMIQKKYMRERDAYRNCWLDARRALDEGHPVLSGVSERIARKHFPLPGKREN